MLVEISSSGGAVYDRIGRGYARQRRPDPRWATAIRAAVGAADTVVNVGGGTGSYEPDDVHLVAVEPSPVMIAQRTEGAAPVVQGVAEHLPFSDDEFDVALAVLTVHHWTDPQRGLRELRRVARRQVVVTFDVEVNARMWLVRDYLPEAADLDRSRTPPPDEIARSLKGAQIAPLHVPADMRDAVLAAHWARPEAYLDPAVHAAASGIAQQPAEIVERAVDALRRDLDGGAWDDRYGHLRSGSLYDAGYRIITGGGS